MSQVDSLTSPAKPPWIKVRAPSQTGYQETKAVVERLSLHTVCREAMCPNIGECWAAHTATFLIMGRHCTRACRFCAVEKGLERILAEPDPQEPRHIALAVKELGLKHAVITSVTRDDLADYGANHFASTVIAIKELSPQCKVELLIPDMRGNRHAVKKIVESGVDVLNHNLETVSRLYPQVRPGADYAQSLSVLKWAKEMDPRILTKSGIMVGLGETLPEVHALMDDLRGSDVDIITIGQYLRPSKAQTPIVRYVTPDEFKELERIALKKGFKFAESGPLVRSSYHAWKHSAAVPG